MKIEEFLHDASSSDLLLPTDHLSASQVGMLNRCEEQYRRRYVLGEIERPGAALILGQAFHRSVEADFTECIREGELLSENALEATYHHAFDTILEEKGGVDEIVWNEHQKSDTVRKIGFNCTKLYHGQVAPRLTPTSLETNFSKEIEPGINVEGIIDFTGKSQIPIIADYKTASRSTRSPKPDWRFQGETYQWVTQKPLEWHVVVKSSRPSVITPLESVDLLQPYREERNQFVVDTYKMAARKISWLMRVFGPDQYWPTTGYTHPWACGYCGYQKTCPAWE